MAASKCKVCGVSHRPHHAEKKLGKHPTQKPKPCSTASFAPVATRGDVVLDPFCGSGTTGVVCARLSRRFVGFDIRGKYLNLLCDV
jgi:DNA modification methylase